MAVQAGGTRPIFITSTFRDMHAERDHLRNVVFPELEERLRQRRHHLEPIDLRWGGRRPTSWATRRACKPRWVTRR